MKKELLILGSTGSIGRSTLQIIDEYRNEFNIKTLIANSNVELIAAQAIKYNVSNIGIYDESQYQKLKDILLSSTLINIVAGKSGVSDLLQQHYDITIAGISGIACLDPILKVMPYTKVIGLANKESIVCAGQLLLANARKYDTKIIPLDSEHSAIFQILDHQNIDKIEKIILTASGGPFYSMKKEDMKYITTAQAIKHPNWDMGAKISVDSATLMNKGLELIEAHYLFDIPISKLEAVIHPQSIVHGLVNYADGSTLAQMGAADMRTPISIALKYPKRLVIKHNRLSWQQLSSMQFFEPDEEKFPCLRLAREALIEGQSHCVALNIANEIAVEKFLQNRISFLKIAEIVQSVLQSFDSVKINSINDVFDVAINIKNKMNGFNL